MNYAIDRNALVKLFGGKVLAAPACQVLPPGFPGHEAYCPYTKNPGAKWSRAGSGQGQAAGRGIRHRGPEGDDHRRGHCRVDARSASICRAC